MRFGFCAVFRQSIFLHSDTKVEKIQYRDIIDNKEL